MSKKEYMKIADVIVNNMVKKEKYDFKDYLNYDYIMISKGTNLVKDLIKMFELNNRNFDKTKFIDYLDKHLSRID